MDADLTDKGCHVKRVDGMSIPANRMTYTQDEVCIKRASTGRDFFLTTNLTDGGSVHRSGLVMLRDCINAIIEDEI